jgi:omega-6 fatty acid desaturase (delta-12 desaturase)
MPTQPEWQAAIAPFRAPIQRAATMQLLNTVVPYVLCTALAYGLCSIAYWAAAPFIVLAGLFTVRSFIISHDCSHGSFTASKRLNDRIGFWTGLIAFTPYLQWRRSHAIHHADSGNVGMTAPATFGVRPRASTEPAASFGAAHTRYIAAHWSCSGSAGPGSS